MPRGPAGIPRPGVDSRLVYNVTFTGDTSLSKNPPKAREAFDMRVNTPQADAFEVFVDKIGDVLLAVNNLAHPTKANVLDVSIMDQGPGNGLSKNETEWQARYVLSGSGIAEFAEKITTASSMIDAHMVLIQGDDGPIENASAIRAFDSGPFEVNTIQIEAD